VGVLAGDTQCRFTITATLPGMESTGTMMPRLDKMLDKFEHFTAAERSGAIRLLKVCDVMRVCACTRVF
jgi:hypothetical protein